MTILQQSILDAFASAGETGAANRVYLEFIKANFIIPIRKDSSPDAPEVLFLTEEGQRYLPVFTDMVFLDSWGAEIAEKMDILRLTGVNLLTGIGEQVIICLDPGSAHQKLFQPAEIARMKGIVLKFSSKP